VWPKAIYLISFFEQISDVKSKITGNKKRKPFMSVNTHHLNVDKEITRWSIISEVVDMEIHNREDWKYVVQFAVNNYMLQDFPWELYEYLAGL
jgi:hypothetical protein